MTKEERDNKILKASELAGEIRDILNSIVWEKQEGQEEHFDRLCKSERIAITGIFNDAVRLLQSTNQYRSLILKK